MLTGNTSLPLHLSQNPVTLCKCCCGSSRPPCVWRPCRCTPSSNGFWEAASVVVNAELFRLAVRLGVESVDGGGAGLMIVPLFSPLMSQLNTRRNSKKGRNRLIIRRRVCLWLDWGIRCNGSAAVVAKNVPTSWSALRKWEKKVVSFKCVCVFGCGWGLLLTGMFVQSNWVGSMRIVALIVWQTDWQICDICLVSFPSVNDHTISCLCGPLPLPCEFVVLMSVFLSSSASYLRFHCVLFLSPPLSRCVLISLVNIYNPCVLVCLWVVYVKSPIKALPLLSLVVLLCLCLC